MRMKIYKRSKRNIGFTGKNVRYGANNGKKFLRYFRIILIRPNSYGGVNDV